MLSEPILLILMLLTFAVGVFTKLPTGVSLMLAALIGAVSGGEGFAIRHLVEGSFGFMEAIMIIATAMIFMKFAEESGILATIIYWMIRKLHKNPSLLIIVMAVFIMFPGMLTGLSSACILTTGILVIPALIAMGMPKIPTGVFVALISVFGGVAPPICIPVMLIGGGVDMPYIGFFWPLLIASFPMAIVISLIFRYKYLDGFNVEEVLAQLPRPVYKEHGFKLFFPIIFVIGYLVLENMLPQYTPHIGVALVFMIGAVICIFCGETFNVIKASFSAIRSSMTVIAILVGVGMFLQILTLTGVRGWLAVYSLNLPEEVKYLAALVMPFIGSAYASASVIGIPLVFVFSAKNAIVVTAGLALMASVGDLMPPPSMLFAYAGEMIKEENHFRLLRFSIPYIILTMLSALLIILFSQSIAKLVF